MSPKFGGVFILMLGCFLLAETSQQSLDRESRVNDFGIVPLKITRESVRDGTSLTFEFRVTGSEEVKVEWSHSPENATDEVNVPKNSEGVQSTSVLFKGRQRFGKTAVTITSGSEWFKISMYKNWNRKEFTAFPALTLKATPPGDLVYKSGQDTNVQIQKSKAGMVSVGGDSFKINSKSRQVFADLTTGGLMKSERLLPSYFIEETDSSTSDDNLQASDLKLRTGRYGYSGVLSWVVTAKYAYFISLVSEIEIGHQAILRPNTQPGPFPEGYLQFVRQGRDGRLVCRLPTYGCEVVCEVYGLNPATLQLYRVGDNGQKELLDFDRTSSDKYGTMGALRVIADRPIVSEVVTLNYECEATGGAVSSQAVAVDFVEPMYLRWSRIERISDTEVKLICQASGVPTPTFTFHGRYETGSVTMQPDNVEVTGGNAIATKVIARTKPGHGVVEGFYCYVTQTLHGREISKRDYTRDYLWR